MWFRRSRPAAALSLAVFVTTFGLPLVSETHAFGGDVDTGWGERGIVVCHPDTQIEIPVDPKEGEHCAICHWVRLLGASTVGARVRPQAPVLVSLATVPHSALGHTADRISGPPRGPPLSSL